MKIIIVGAGKLGWALAKNLRYDGHEITILEIDKEKAKNVARELDIKTFCCDGTKIESIANAMKKRGCDVFISITDKDANNLVACEIAKKHFKIRRTIAKANDSKNTTIMKRLGVDLVFDDAESLSKMVLNEIDTERVSFVSDLGTPNAALKKYTIQKNWEKDGSKVCELEIPENCVLVYLKRNGDFIIPRGNTMLFSEDEVFALSVGNSGRKLKKIFSN